MVPRSAGSRRKVASVAPNASGGDTRSRWLAVQILISSFSETVSHYPWLALDVSRNKADNKPRIARRRGGAAVREHLMQSDTLVGAPMRASNIRA